MGALKEVGVREFRDHGTKYLSGSESVAISRHGQIIGIYVPVKRDEEKVRQAWDNFDQVLQETGMTEDELADLLDLSKPLAEWERCCCDGRRWALIHGEA